MGTNGAISAVLLSAFSSMAAAALLLYTIPYCGWSIRPRLLHNHPICHRFHPFKQPKLDSQVASTSKFSISFYIHICYDVHRCREQVVIPREKPFIYLKGEGKRNTFLMWNGFDNIVTGASEADNTLAKGITFLVIKFLTSASSPACTPLILFLKSFTFYEIWWWCRSQLTMSELNSQGPGANSEERVKWAKKMSEKEATRLASTSFIDDEGWVKIAFQIFNSWSH